MTASVRTRLSRDFDVERSRVASRLISALPEIGFMAGDAAHIARPGVSCFVHVAGREDGRVFYLTSLILDNISVADLKAVELTVRDRRGEVVERLASTTGKWCFSLPNEQDEYQIVIRATESLEDTVQSFDASVSRYGKLDVSNDSSSNAAANHLIASTHDDANSQVIDENRVDPRNRTISFRHENKDDRRCRYGVVVARIFASQTDHQPIGSLLIPIHAKPHEDVYRGLAHVPGKILDRQLTGNHRVEFYDMPEDIQQDFSMHDLAILARRGDLPLECRRRIERLIDELARDD